MKDEKGISVLVGWAAGVVSVEVVGGLVAYFTGAILVAWGVVVLVTVGLLVGMLFAVERRWAGPVRRLGRVAGEMGRRDWSARATPEGAGAVRELAGEVNALAGKARLQMAGLEEQWRVVQALVDTLPDPVMLVEGHRRVTLINSAAGRLLGVEPGRAVGRWLGEVVTDRGLLETFEAVPPAAAAATAGPVEREVRVEREGGQRLTYQAVAVRTADGVLLVLRDVTALAETVRIKTDFVANASHELRTPIAAIKAAFETLREVYAEDPGQAERCVRIIEGHVRRLEEMLRDLLDLSRLESPELRVEWREVRPEELFATVRGALGGMASERGVELRASAADGTSGPFAGDVRLLNMVMKNLVENAVKFTPAGGHVEVSAGRAGEGSGAVVLSVRDTGIGIPAEHVNRVFERFYQVDPARTGSAGRGSGLGLAIVKHAVGAMGGTVSIESEVGKGTVVTCTIPQREAGTRMEDGG